MKETQKDQIREAVRQYYGEVATREQDSSCCTPQTGCCGSDMPASDEIAEKLGYAREDLQFIPEGANMGLGCGNPHAIAQLKPGETVLDLGSGGGFDCFLAARQVGKTGKVIGVDMTPDMISKARRNADKRDDWNVEFRLGEIENLPVADNLVDVIISNCVINLSPDKQRVFEEAYRVLKSGGRLAISDVVATAELPPALKQDLTLHAGCVTGAESIQALTGMLESAGFQDIRITPKDETREVIREWVPGTRIDDYITSAIIEARKP
ncbi:MAG: arsenite methyltransferase [Bacillaceae bacterium]|nr:arsenite methyltransferase [Bacillaceae bacterium]